MAKFTGRQQEVGIARETTRGTLVVPTFWVPKVNFTVESKAQKAKFQGNYGVLAGGDEALVTQKWSEGELELELTDKIAGLLFYALFGSLSSASFNSVYKHTLTVQNSVQPTTLSLWLKDPIGSVVLGYAMAMVNSLQLKVELGELVKAVVGFIAKGHKDFTSQTPSYSAENKFAHHHLQLRIGSDLATIGSGSKINVQNLQINFDRQVIRENALGTVQPVDILARAFRITGTLELTYEDRTYRDYMLNGTTKAMRIQLVKGETTIGSTNPAVQIDLSKVHFEAWEPSHPLDEVAMQTVNFEALWDVSNSILIGANTFVVNEEDAY